LTLFEIGGESDTRAYRQTQLSTNRPVWRVRDKRPKMRITTDSIDKTRKLKCS
jgi:hypothetical protein